MNDTHTQGLTQLTWEDTSHSLASVRWGDMPRRDRELRLGSVPAMGAYRPEGAGGMISVPALTLREALIPGWVPAHWLSRGRAGFKSSRDGRPPSLWPSSMGHQEGARSHRISEPSCPYCAFTGGRRRAPHLGTMQAQAVTSSCLHPCLVPFRSERPAPLSTAALGAGHRLGSFSSQMGRAGESSRSRVKRGGEDSAQLACHTTPA